MKILVTGGAGFVGSRVVEAYIKAGHEVIIIDNLSTGSKQNIHPKAKFYFLDINSCLDEVFENEYIDIINHHAAQTSVDNSIRTPISDLNENVFGTLNLLEYAKSYKVKKFIYASSAAVYGEPVYLPIDEKHPIDPISPYGISKHTVEHYLYFYYKTHGLDYTILRYSNVYGPRQNNSVISIFINKMLKNEEITINGNGHQDRNFVYVDDVAEANVLAMNDDNKGNIYNIGGKDVTSINVLFDKLGQIIKYNKSPIYGPEKRSEIKRMCFNNDKAGKQLGWFPKWDLSIGLNSTITSLRGQHGLEEAEGS